MAKLKPKKNKEIEEHSELYQRHLESDKTIEGPLQVDHEKRNQANFYDGELPVQSVLPWGNTSMECSIRKEDEYNYTMRYMTDALKDGLLCRLDAGVGTHRNRAPGIPLELTSVPMPHLHVYRGDGYDIAYPIYGLDYSLESSAKFEYTKGFSYFCEQLHIRDASGTDASIIYSPAGFLPLQLDDDDPNANVDFPE